MTGRGDVINHAVRTAYERQPKKGWINMQQMNQEYRQEEHGYQQEEQQDFTWQEYQPAREFEGVAHKTQQRFAGEPPFNNANLVAALCYSLGWFSGLVFLLFTRQSRFVRFHA